MVDGRSGVVTFLGCAHEGADCDAGHFECRTGGSPRRVTVRVTAQIERILAKELGHDELTRDERERILEAGGRHLLEERLRSGRPLEAVMYLDSRIFLSPGAEKALLHESGLLPA